MSVKVMRVAIANHGKAVGKYLPEEVVYNSDVEAIFAENEVLTSSGKPLTAAWMAERVGLDKRYWAAKGQFSSHLGIIAAKRALRKGELSPYHPSVIRVGSSTPDSLYSGMCCLIQNGLVRAGRPNLQGNAYDISAACTSGLQALASVAEYLLTHPWCRYGIAVAAETMSKIADPSKPNFQVWGDGAVAVVLELTNEDRGLIYWDFQSQPEDYDKTESIGLGVRYLGQNVTPDAWFDGPKVHEFIINTVKYLLPHTIEKTNMVLGMQGKSPISLDDIDMFGIHQGNLRAIQKIVKYFEVHYGIPPEKFYINFPEVANTSSASPLLCLADMIELGLVKEGDRVMLVGLGGGLTYGSVVMIV